MKKLTFFFVLTAFTMQVNAQLGYGKLEDIEDIEAKPLLVVLDQKSPSLSKKIERNPEKFEKYEVAIEDYNEALKKAFSSTWTFSQGVQFVTKSEFVSIRDDKSKKGKYAYFSNNINRSPSILSSSSRAGDPDTYSLELGLTDKKRPVYEMMYTTLHPTEADLVMLIQQFQNYLKGRIALKSGKKSKKELKAEMKSNSNILKTKTLLLDEDYVDKDLPKKIGDIYKYEYEITTKDKIDQAILSKDSKYAYIRAIPIMQQSGGKNSAIKISKLIYVQYVISAEDGMVLGLARPSAMMMGGNLGTLASSSNQKTTVKDLKKIASNMD